MKDKTAAIIAYITWIGFLVAYLRGDKSSPFVRQHLNQALIINVASIIGSIATSLPVFGKTVGGIISLAAFVFWIMGLVRAAKESMDPLPLIGDIQII